MNTFPWIPSRSTSSETVPRVLRAQFGDGYSQETLDGINAIPRNWDIVFEPIHGYSGTDPTLQELDAFMRVNAGLRFQWVQPKPFDGEGLKVFRCRRWGWTYDEGLIVGFRATFEQQPET